MRKLLLVLLITTVSNAFAKTYYVNISAAGLNNGTSWQDAFIRIDSAMVHAVKGDTIKVAAGIYRPTQDTDTDRSFGLVNGIVFLGGYPNTGSPSDFERDWKEFPTILSGTIGQDYSSHSVLRVQLVDTSTIIDGFFIMNGSGDGAAINIKNSIGLTIRNTIFEQNQYRVVHVENSSVAFVNCIFNDNVYFTSVIYNSLGSNTTFKNCIITGNGTEDRDVSSLFINEDASLKIINCDIVNNTGSVFFSKGSGNIILKNSIIWNNRNTLGVFEENDINPYNQSLIIDHCITQTYYDKAINSIIDNTDPRFLNIKKPAGDDNKFYTADDGLQLLAPCSPALNYGDNNAVSDIGFDILGHPRIYDNGIIDLGAYEFQANVGTPLKTVFVNSSVINTGNDGSSWQNAFKTLQEAFFYCADTIKIAEGTYYTTNSKYDSSFLLENGKVIMGGYPSIGNPTDNERNPDKYPTVLKRYNNQDYYAVKNTILKSYHNDSTTIIDGIDFNNESNHSVHHPLFISYESKVKVNNCKFLSTGAKLIGNGIAISKSSSPFITNSTFDTHESSNIKGAIISSDYSAPTITHCIFQGVVPLNSQLKTGFAINFINSSGIIDSCSFIRNSPLTHTSVLYLDNSNPTIKKSIFRSIATWKNVVSITNKSKPLIENCGFKNIARSTEYLVSIDNSSPVFNKCVFDSSEYFIRNTNNSSPIFNNCVSVNGVFMRNGLSSPTVNNSTIVNTSTFTSATRLVINENSSVFTANNTIFWSDKLDPDQTDISDSKSLNNPSQNSFSYLFNCITQKYGITRTNGNLVGENPRFFQFTNIYGADGKIFTDDDGIRLAACSPAINAGNNTSSLLLSTDILDKARIVNAIVDIGAYEFQETFKSTNSYYVNSKATGANTGEDWQNAYVNLQDAICNSCADTIRVAQGIYKPAVLARDSTFFINRALSLFGGFPDSGNPGDEQRDAIASPTILSGNIGNLEDSTDNSNSIITITGVKDSVTIDGFEIRDSYMNGGTRYNALGGGGISAYYNHTNIRNCRFLNNIANPKGGAISINRLATSSISKCIFSNNYAQNEGGALSFDGIHLELFNCVFEKNYSINGGAIKLSSDSAIIYNNVFYKNFAHNGGRGGAIHGKNGRIYNCTFLENFTTKPDMMYGGAVFGGNGGLRIWNSIFHGNMLGTSSTTLGADLDWDGNYSYVFHSLLQAKRRNVNGANLYETDPKFVNSLNPKGADGKWLTSDDELQLDFNSPGIDYGDNAVINSIASDILDNQRIYNNVVDLGAYEFQNRPIAKAGKDTTVCVGTDVKIGTKGNPSHIYNWTSSPSGFFSTDSAVVVTPVVTTSYYLEVSNGTTVAKDTIIVNISSSLLPIVKIETPLDTICQNSSVSFKAISTYGGDNAVYQWQVNDINVENNDGNIFTSSTLNDNSRLKVLLTSSISCASQNNVESNVVTIKVRPNVTPSVAITPSDTSVCYLGTIKLTALSESGGPSPSYQWQRNGFNVGSSREIFSESGVANETQYRVIMVSNAACAIPGTDTSETITVKIKTPVNPSVTINSSATSICFGSPVTFSATSYNTGDSPFYQWMLNNAPTGTNSTTYTTTTLRNNDKVRLVLTSSENCGANTTASSNIITTTVVDKTIAKGKAETPLYNCVNNPFTVTFDGTNLPVNTTINLWESINNSSFSKISSKTYNGALLSLLIENNHNEVVKRYFFSLDLPSGTDSCMQAINSDTVTTTVIQLTSPVIKKDNSGLTVTNAIPGSQYTWQKLDNTFWVDVIPIANGFAYKPVDDGIYRVKSELYNCTEYSSSQEFKIHDSLYEAPNINLYPNPTTGLLIIDSLNLSDKWKRLDIITIDGGQKVASFDIANLTTITVHLEYLPAGAYLALFIRENGETYYKKFLKL